MKNLLIEVPESFETERLLVRCPLPGDGAMMHPAIEESMELLSPWMEFVHPKPTYDDIEEYTRSARARFITREDLAFHLFDKSTGGFLGSAGLHRIDWKARKFEIGYWLRQSEQGKGYVTEAVNGLTEFADRVLLANRIEIRTDARNTASRRVAERCGYHLEAIFLKNYVDPAGTIQDDCIYVKIRLDDLSMGYPVFAGSPHNLI